VLDADETSIHARAGHTTDPLRLPGAPKGQSTEARRWRDLTRQYGALLGPERLRRPDVRAQLSVVVSLTLLLERLEARVARDEPVDPSHVIQSSYTLRSALAELGISAAPPEDDEQPDARSYLRERETVT